MSVSNLLDQFILKHIQISRLNVELLKVSSEPSNQEAKVELNLTPRLMQADSGDALPAYQVTATLRCRGGSEAQDDPAFTSTVGFEAVYQQIKGEPMDVSEFTSNHASLTRQLYPLLQNELRTLLGRLGLQQIQLPFDITAKTANNPKQKVRVSESLH